MNHFTDITIKSHYTASDKPKSPKIYGIHLLSVANLGGEGPDPSPFFFIFMHFWAKNYAT